MSDPPAKEHVSGFSSSSDDSVVLADGVQPPPKKMNNHAEVASKKAAATTTTSTTNEEDTSASFSESSTRNRFQEKALNVLAKATEAVASGVSRRLRRTRTRSGGDGDGGGGGGGGGGSCDGTTGSSSGGAGGSSPNKSAPTATAIATLPGVTELETLMNVAEYEIHQDPYRGIMSQQQSLETQTSITTPWNACEWGTLPPEPIEDPATELLDPQIVVRHVGNCACPSMKEWTRTILEERAKKISSSNNSNKKRKRNSKSNDNEQEKQHPSSGLLSSSSSSSSPKQLFTVGFRPQGDKRLRGDNFVCPCDYNPLCLASLGGIINEVIEERCRALDASLPLPTPPPKPASSTALTEFFKKKKKKKLTTKTSNDDTKDDDGDGDAELEVLGGPPPPKKQKESSSSSSSSTPKSKELVIVDVDKVVESSSNGRKFRDPALDDSSADTLSFQGDNNPSTPITKDAKTSGKNHQSLTTPLLKHRVGPLPEEEDPAEIFSSSTIPPQDFSCIEFSSKTNEALQKVRRSIVVDTAPIRSYIHRTLRIDPSTIEDKDGLTIDKYIKILKDWHERLQFHNPVLDTKQLSGDRISLSMPPGIRNLGATCYLNTQLQCLAQNVTFLEGIFSWHVVDTNHKMNDVMNKLQSLLAEMFLGGNCKLTTRPFSDALGLQHHEQQDPNEFARLLFDRMEESFQQCDNDGDLSNLLRRIFHGTSTYETICMTCGKASERSEGFMDLNLPIVKPPKEPKKNTGTIKEAFALSSAKNVDTDLQYCLDQYTCAEMLDGENQYFCDACNAKRDAKRVLKLTELPPVLNVQLSRYVYDREKGEKKKVSDKVLLPTSLTVQTGGVTKKKYLLCAVMKHQGTSAYSGHYLAEAMDWLTGKWFEFNDEIVKLLPEGPSSSFDPEMVEEMNVNGESSGTNKENTTKLEPSGSQDAYNMYYVEEGYLSQTAKKSTLWREKLCKSGPNAGEVLDDITDDRKGAFRDLTEMCFEDSYISERLSRRKAGIRKYMLPNVQALVPNKSASGGEIGAWVPTDFLKRYLQCREDNDLDSIIGGFSPILNEASILCEHKCLSPKTARAGKLLPIPIYNALLSLLRGERALLHQGDASEVDEIEGCKITPTSNLICHECSKTHRDQLSEKLELLRAAKELYDALDTKKADAAVDFNEGEEPKSDEEMYVYVVSRQTATKFRRRVGAIIKSVAKCEGGGKVEHTLNSNEMPIYEGLGAIDISSITQHTLPENGNGKLPVSKASDSEDLDKYFNTNITCSHRNCNSMYNGRQVRYLGQREWSLVKKLFPDAIEHRRKRELKNGKNDVDIYDQDCSICRAEKASVETLKEAIQAWAARTRADTDLKSLLDGKRTLSREQEVSNFAAATSGCRLVHKSDITTWREAVKLLSNTQKIKGDSCGDVRSFAENLVFPSCHTVVLEFENEPVDKLVASIRSFICREHHGVVKRAILGNAASNDENELRTLADYITVVGNEEYRAYISSLATLLRILRVDGNPIRNLMGSPIAVDEEKAFIKQVRDVAASHHPLIQNHRCNEASEGENTNALSFTHEGSVKKFTLVPALCEHDTCIKECAPLQDVAKEKDDERIESISVDSCDAKPSAKKSTKNRGAGVSDPILVESDLDEDTNDGLFPFRVFELESGATKEQALDSLQSISAIPNDFEANANDLRRSSRKRKANYPCGPLLSENSVKIGLYHNFAAICLCMYEQSNIPANYGKLFLVLTPQFEKPLIDEASPRGTESELTLEEKIHNMREGRPDDDNFDSTKHVLLLYQTDSETSNGDDPLHETLIESLFQFANFGSRSEKKSGISSSTKKGPSTPVKKKSRPSERGFMGTLLQSGAPPAPAPSSNGGGDDDDDSVIQSHPEASTISDDDKDRPRPSMVVDDTSPQSSRPSSIDINRMVLSDDDDSQDEAILKRSPTFSKKQSRDSAPKNPPNNAATIIDTSIIDREEEARAELSQRVFEDLEKCVDESTADHTRMWNAMHYAITEFPALNDAPALLDIAYAKYMES